MTLNCWPSWSVTCDLQLKLEWIIYAFRPGMYWNQVNIWHASLGKGDQVNLTENDAISCFVH